MQWILRLFPRSMLDKEINRRNHFDDYIEMQIQLQRELQAKLVDKLDEVAKFGGTPMPATPPPIEVPILSAADVANLRHEAEQKEGRSICTESDVDIPCHAWYIGQPVRCVEAPTVDEPKSMQFVLYLGRRYIIEDINAVETSVPTLKLIGIDGYWNSTRFEAE